MADNEPPERDMKDFDFMQLVKFRVKSSEQEVPVNRGNLLACSSKYGLLVYCAKQSLHFVKTSDLLKINEGMGKERNKKVIEDFPVERKVDLSTPALFISINADGKYLAVATKEMGHLSILLFDLNIVADKATSPQAFARFRVSATPAAIIQDLAWNPGLPNMLAVCTNDGNVELVDITDQPKLTAALPAAVGATCFCWSPKGKQLLVGKKNGTAAQYDHTLTEKKQWACPSMLEGPQKVVDIVWQSTYIFMAAYLPTEASVTDQPKIIMTISNKENNTKFINFDDICYGSGEERKAQYFFHLVLQWEMIFMASSNALEVNIVGKNLDDKVSWEHWNLGDCSRAELPLTDSSNDTFPVGMAVDYSPQAPIIINDSTQYAACPVMYLLSTDGILVGFHLSYRHKDAPQITSPATALDPTTARKGGSPQVSSPTSAVSGGTGQSLPSGLKSFTSTPSSSSGSSFPVATTSTPSLFGAPSAAGAAPSFQFTGLNPPSVSKPMPSASPLLSGLVGQKPAAVAPTAASSQPAPTAKGLFATSAANQSPGLSLFPTGGGTNAAAKPGIGQGLGQTSFSFGKPATSFAAPAPGQPQTPASSAMAKPASQAQSSSSLSQLLTSQTNAATPAFSTPGFGSSQPTSAAGAAAFGRSQPVNAAATAFANSQTPNATATAFGTTQPVNPAVAKGLTPSQGSFSLGKAGISSGVPPTQGSFSLGKAGISSGVPPTQGSFSLGKAGSPATSIPPPKPTQAGAGGQPTAVKQTPQESQKETQETEKSVDAKLDRAFSQNIWEEIHDFEELLKQQRARAREGIKSIGSKEEMQRLRQDTEEMTNFTRNIMAVTKEHLRETQEQKSTSFNLFVMAEECKAKHERDQDPHYHSLLQGRTLDPASAEQLKKLQGMAQTIESNVVEVDAILNAQWEEHQTRRRKQERLAAPTGDIIYKSIKNNNDLIADQRRKLEKLQEQFSSLKLYGRGGAKDLRILSMSEGDKMPSPVESSLRLGKTLQQQVSVGMTPEKVSRLRDLLSQRTVPLVRSSPIANISLSRIVQTPLSLSADKSRQQQRPQQIQNTPTGPPAAELPLPAGRLSFQTGQQQRGPGNGMVQQAQDHSALPLHMQSSKLFLAKTLLQQQQQNLQQLREQVAYEDITPTETEDDEEDGYDDEEDGYEDEDEDEEETAYVGISGVPGLPTFAAAVGASGGGGGGDGAGLIKPPQTSTVNLTSNTSFTPLKTTTQTQAWLQRPNSTSIVVPATTASVTQAVPTRQAASKDLFGVKTSGTGLDNTAEASPIPRSGSVGFSFGAVSSAQATSTTATAFTFGRTPSSAAASTATTSTVTTAATTTTQSGGFFKIPADPKQGSVFGGTAVFGQKLMSESSSAAPVGSLFGYQATPSKNVGFGDLSKTEGTKTTGSESQASTVSAVSQVPSSSSSSVAQQQTGAVPASAFSFTSTSVASSTPGGSVFGGVKSDGNVPSIFGGKTSSLSGSTFAFGTSPSTSTNSSAGFSFTSALASVPTSSSAPGTPNSPSTEQQQTTPQAQQKSFSVFGAASGSPSQSPSTFGAVSSSVVSNTTVLPASASSTESSALATPQPSTSTGVEVATPKLPVFGDGSNVESAVATSTLASTAATTTTTTTTPVVASSTSVVSTPVVPGKSLFGQPVATSSSVASPVASVASLSSPTQPSQSSASTSAFPVSSTSAVSSAASSNISSEVGSSVFGRPVNAAASQSVFGFGTTPATTGSGTGLFGSSSSSSTTGLFGSASSPASTSSTGGLFGSLAASTQGTTPSVFGGGVGTTAAPTSSGGMFGSSSSSPFGSSGGTGLFGTSVPASSGSVFGTPQTSTTSSNVFGFSTTTSSGGLFGGGGNNSTSGASTGLFGSSTGGGLFGQPQTSNTSTFGFGQQQTTSTSSFGQPSAFGQQSASSGSGLFGFSGLGGKPSEEKKNTNVFGASQVFGTSTNQNTGLFGSTGNTSFNSPSGSGAGSGSFSSGGSGVAFSGFGVGASQPATPASGASAFGGSPAFGSSPSFGGSAVFGGKPAFGSASPGGFGSSPAFGSTPTFGNTAASPTVGSAGGFSSFANAAAPSFGQLAQSSSTFGGGSGGFGSSNQPAGFGSPQQTPSLFGQAASSPSFGGNAQPAGFGNAPSFGNSAAFSSYRG